MLKSTFRRYCLTSLLAMACAWPSLSARAAGAATETPEQRAARMKWFAEARFGLFIHWGVYSVPAGEWKGKTNYGEWFLEETHMPVSQYEKFAQQFNPVKFDAKQWVALAKEAGVKYIVITSKHHDGFGMFPSQETDWCIKSTPFQRDPLKELSAACREAGIKFCLYHSIMDWHHPDWGTRRAWNDKATRQARHGPLHGLHEAAAQGTGDATTARWGSSGSTANGKTPGRTSAASISTPTAAACSRTSSSTTAWARPVPAWTGWTRARAWATTARPSRMCRPTVLGRASIGNRA